MKYTGQLVTGDFEDNTMTFKIDGEMILQAGKYIIDQIQVGNQVKNLGIANVVESKPNEKAALKHAIDAIYFNDNSDYLSGLYGVVRSLTGLNEPTEEDIKKLFEELNPE